MVNVKGGGLYYPVWERPINLEELSIHRAPMLHAYRTDIDYDKETRYYEKEKNKQKGGERNYELIRSPILLALY